MNNPDYLRLRELAWRRKLTKAELAEWCAAHPGAAADAETEAALSDALARLPEVPVPSNFTARVLQGLEREVMRPAARNWSWVWRLLVPRAGVAILVIGVGVFGYQQHRVKEQGAVRDSLVMIAAVPLLPNVEVLQNFDVIQKLDTESAADQELLALLK